MMRIKTHGTYCCCLILIILFLTVSCRNDRDLVYFANSVRNETNEMINTYNSFIFPGDMLYIHVSSIISDNVVALNKETNHLTSLSFENMSDSSLYYHVSDSGTIYFPYLGIIKVAGLCVERLEDSIKSLLIERDYVNDPVVDAYVSNLRMTVLGEVKYPQQIRPDGPRLTILEALAMCGDLTIDGVRDNITVVRSTSKGLVVGNIDLTDSSMFSSPYYYLQQNDIVYVEPSEKKKRMASRDQNLPRYIAIGVSLGSMIRTLYRAVVTDARYNR